MAARRPHVARVAATKMALSFEEMAPGAAASLVNIIHPDSLSRQDQDQIEEFKRTFRQRTGRQLSYVVRAPGRVNLIGDHVDYHGFAVLPMAIENCILLGLTLDPGDKSGDDETGWIEICNQDQVSYPTVRCRQSFLHAADLEKSHKWHHYILCGLHGVLANQLLHVQPEQLLEHAKAIATSGQNPDGPLNRLRSCSILVHSNLPAASGLSSSSALVCASAMATCLLLRDSGASPELQLNSLEWAEKCSKFEHLIGTHGGGMDQAVIMTAQDGYAKFVEFVPTFSCSNVRLPPDAVWLVSHCGLSYPKAATSGFNLRVLETKLGAAMIVRLLQADDVPLDRSITLARVRGRLFEGKSTEAIVETIRSKVFSKDRYSLDEICLSLGLSLAELKQRFDISESLLADGLRDGVRLAARCEHVFEEAHRVELFRAAGEPVQLGRLMTESHISLRDKFQCSHPALDRLVQVALEAGALGARLTGAGWGGCIVSLTDSANCQRIAERLGQMSKFTFRTEPRSGCAIIKV